MSDHGRLRIALGAYALGALDASERAEVDDHLAACVTCRDELARLAVLPGMLGRLSVEEAAEELVPPRIDLTARIVETEAKARQKQRWVLRAWQAAAVLAVAAAVLLALPLGSPGERLTVQPVPATAVTGTAVTQGRAWGTAVELRPLGRDGRRPPPARRLVGTDAEREGPPGGGLRLRPRRDRAPRGDHRRRRGDRLRGRGLNLRLLRFVGGTEARPERRTR